MVDKFMELMGCVPPWIPVFNIEEHTKCSLFHELDDKEQVSFELFKEFELKLRKELYGNKVLNQHNIAMNHLLKALLIIES